MHILVASAVVHEPVDQPGLGQVEVCKFRCPDYLCEGRIVYRSGLEEVGFYEHHRWAMNPRQAITQFMADALRGAVAIQERRRSRKRHGSCIRADGQYRGIRSGRPGPRRPGRLHDIGALMDAQTGWQVSSAVCRQPHGPPSIVWWRPLRTNWRRGRRNDQIPGERIAPVRTCPTSLSAGDGPFRVRQTGGYGTVMIPSDP